MSEPLSDDVQTTEPGGVSRRSLLAGTAAAVVGAGLVRAGTSSAAGGADDNPLDDTFDVVVVGAGAAGFSAALGVLREDPTASVVVLEARPSYGGTSYRSGGRLWICNNADMRAAGLADPKDEAIAYMARLAHPDDYKPHAHRHGLTKRQYAQLEAYYDNGADMLDFYRESGWLPWHAETGVFLPGTKDPLGLSGQFAPDYHPEFEENVPGKGRSIMPELFDPSGTGASDIGRTTTVGNFGSSIYGPDVIEWMHYSFRTLGGQVHLGTRVVDLVVTKTADGKKVEGVETVAVLDGGNVLAEPAPYTELPVKKTYTARRGVIFATGGFSKSSAKVASSFTGQKAISGGGCAVVSAVGDLSDLAKKHGFLLENMDQCWFVENIYAQYMADPNSAVSPNYLLFQAYWLAGDSMIVVNRKGVRVVNEKLNYNDRTKVHFADPDNSFLVSVFDKHSYDNFLGLGGQILPTGPAMVGPADTLEDLQAQLKTHMDQYAGTKAFGLDGAWASTLGQTVERFNGFAKSGVDEDFHRGETSIDVWWHAFCLAFHGGQAVSQDCISANTDENGNRYPNVTMRPLEGPFYAVVLSSGMQDTKGGPAIDEFGRVLDLDENPVEGLYGAGNCIGSPAGAGYWGAGGTLGPATVVGHTAGRHAAARKA